MWERDTPRRRKGDLKSQTNTRAQCFFGKCNQHTIRVPTITSAKKRKPSSNPSPHTLQTLTPPSTPYSSSSASSPCSPPSHPSCPSTSQSSHTPPCAHHD